MIGPVGKPISDGFRTLCQSDTDFRVVWSSIYKADPTSIRSVRKTCDFRYRHHRTGRWHAREIGGFLRLVRVAVLVSSPYAYQKASWLVPAYLHQQGLDTSTPAGRAMFQRLGLIAEFERAIDPQTGCCRASLRARAEGYEERPEAIGRPAITPGHQGRRPRGAVRRKSERAIARRLGIGQGHRRDGVRVGPTGRRLEPGRRSVSWGIRTTGAALASVCRQPDQERLASGRAGGAAGHVGRAGPEGSARPEPPGVGPDGGGWTHEG